MGSSQFSIRLDDDVIAEYDAIASQCKVKRAQVIDWALEAYKAFYEANGNRMLTTSDLDDLLAHIHDRARLSKSPFQILRAAEEPHEPGKVINPAAAGGVGIAPGKKYPKAARQKSSS